MSKVKRDFLVLDEYPYTLKPGDEITLCEDIRIPRHSVGCPNGYTQSSMSITAGSGRAIGNNWRNEEFILFLGTGSDAWPAIIHLVQRLTVFTLEPIEATSNTRRFRLADKALYELYPGYTIKDKMYFSSGDTVKLALDCLIPEFPMTTMSMFRHDLAPWDAKHSIGMNDEEDLFFPSVGVNAWSEIMHLFGALTGLRYTGERSYEGRASTFIYTLENA